MSTSDPATGRRRRQHSRIHRFTRFRTTAPPTLRLTVMPRRPAPGLPKASRFGPDARRPRFWMARYSVRLRTRPARGKRSGRREAGSAGRATAKFPRLLLGHAHGELVAPLAPTPTENLAARLGAHALAKSMRALAALAVRLKSPLHDGPPGCLPVRFARGPTPLRGSAPKGATG